MEANGPAADLPPDPSREPGPPSARGSAFRAVRWRKSDVILGVAPLVLANLASRLIGRVSPLADLRWCWIPLTLLSFAWMVAIPLGAARRRGVGPPALPSPRRILVEVSIGLLAVPIVFLVFAVIMTAMTVAAGEPVVPGPTLEGVFRSPARYEPIVLMLLAVFVGPIAEEALFRGMLYNALRQGMPIVPASLIQGMVFGLIHPFGLLAGSLIALFGTFLALIYEWRRTLLAPIALHMGWNALAVALMAWGAAVDAEGPMLGIRGGPEATSCRVIGVSPGGAAEAAGLEIDDVIIAIDGEPIADFKRLVGVVASKKAGDRIAIEFDRDGVRLRAGATLKRRGEGSTR